MNTNTNSLYRFALGLSIFTIIYNLPGGMISVLMGAADETLTLFGFGLNSSIEIISGIGILLMMRRRQLYSGKNKSRGHLSCIVTLISLFIFGFYKSRLTGWGAFTGGLKGMLIGALAAAAAFLLIRVISPNYNG